MSPMKKMLAVLASSVLVQMGCGLSATEEAVGHERQGQAIEVVPECVVEYAAAGKVCGGTGYTASYKKPSQRVYVTAADATEAAKKCAEYIIENGTPTSSSSAASCPGCPDGSTGCAVTNAQAKDADVGPREADGTYLCGTSTYIRLTYDCSKCIANMCAEPLPVVE